MNDNSYGQGAQVAGSSAVSFMLGAVVGAAIALLMAPDSGAETRQRLASAAKRVTNKARETANDLAQDAKDAMEEGKREFQQRREPSRPGI